jgi:hypothetical protein
MRFILLILGILMPVASYAECDFRTADYLTSLATPKSIKSIDIEISKSSKFARNQFKILTSKSKNIPNKLKKKFRAEILVNYDFGVCKYLAKVRQSGDWKDHIELVDGNPIQSLDIKLKDGNVVGATKFKLLIPKTRNGRSEILGALLLRKLDFIAPETFEVSVSVNGIQSLMLFQEKAEKELLERNLRREGAIFEGDESLLWSYQNHENFELTPLALSRLSNDNWFKKGHTSQRIVIDSHKRLQKAYLDYAYSSFLGESNLFMQVNSSGDYLFNDYHRLLLAMGGAHALTPHNRKFYFNSIEDRFEPIYYDGDISFGAFSFEEKIGHESLIGAPASIDLIERVKILLASEALKKGFSERVASPSDDTFINTSIAQVINNLENFKSLSIPGKKSSSASAANDIIWYKKFQREMSVQQNIVQRIELQGAYADLHLNGNENKTFSISELSKILSNNNTQGDRYVVIHQDDPIEKERNFNELTIGSNLIRMSKGVGFDVDELNKKVSFTQHNPSDWVMFLGGDYSNWEIYFKGLPKSQAAPTSGQRFNELGLTGCLTLYQTIINNVQINVSNGQCEDSLNLLRVEGDNVKVKIKDAFADALDADFSNLDISLLNIINAGNDCFDVSGGVYSTGSAELKNCSDKALSIGEMSTYSGEDVFIDGAEIGISSKDFSQVSVKRFKAEDVSYCGEAKQKKQEFGGGDLKIESVDCNAEFSSDKESLIRVGGM